jgi:hypothetical protein
MLYSKSRVDRAGALIADRMQASMKDSSTFAPSGELGDAIDIIEW